VFHYIIQIFNINFRDFFTLDLFYNINIFKNDLILENIEVKSVYND